MAYESREVRMYNSGYADGLSEGERKARKYQLAWLSARRRARTARTRGLVDAENAIRNGIFSTDTRDYVLGMRAGAKIVADLKEGR